MESSNSEVGVGDQYNLKWNNHLANFVQTFIEHQHAETLVDVTLSCEGQYIKTHKLILSACSDYFHSIFQVHTTLPHPIIFLNGVRFSDLKYILHFMYHGEVKVLDKDLPHVLSLGEALQIKGLSSVKLRDVPPESTPPVVSPTKVPIPKVPVKTTKVVQSVPNNSTPPIQTKRVLNEEVAIALKNDAKPLFDYSRSKLKVVSPSQINLKEHLPLRSTEKLPSNLPVLNEVSSTINTSTSRSQELANHRPIKVDVKNPIPKPPHAFMIFANEWRKKLTVEHPGMQTIISLFFSQKTFLALVEENNKEISVRLGDMWKNLLPETKSIYYREAKRAEEEHRQKYPNYDASSSNSDLKRKADVLQDSTNSTSAVSKC